MKQTSIKKPIEPTQNTKNASILYEIKYLKITTSSKWKKIKI